MFCDSAYSDTLRCTIYALSYVYFGVLSTTCVGCQVFLFLQDLYFIYFNTFAQNTKNTCKCTDSELCGNFFITDDHLEWLICHGHLAYHIPSHLWANKIDKPNNALSSYDFSF